MKLRDMTREQLLARVNLLADELEACEDEARQIQQEINKIYGMLDNEKQD